MWDEKSRDDRKLGRGRRQKLLDGQLPVGTRDSTVGDNASRRCSDSLECEEAHPEQLCSNCLEKGNGL